MTLQILVNHYREPLEIVWRLLHSIEQQIGIAEHSIEILICTDGYEYELTDSAFDKCRFPIRYFIRPHSGVCKTRNALLDASTADYLMFCDCDDMFSKSDGLHKLLGCAMETDANIVGSDYDVEFKNDDDFVYRISHQNVSRVHGKIFKHTYLLRENLRFPDEMEFSGDMYFLYLAYHLTDKIIWLPDNFYIWKWMPKSVTRGKDHYSVQTYDMVLKCYTLTMREFIRRERMELCNELLMDRLHAAYIDYFSEKFNEAPDEFSLKAREAISSMVREFHSIYLAIPEEDRRQNYIRKLLSRRTYGPSGKFVGLVDWLNGI